MQPVRLYFYLQSALGIIPSDHCDRKTPKPIILLKLSLLFLRFNSGTVLLFKAMLVLTSYSCQLQ